MVNLAIIAAEIGMILIGVAAILWWKISRNVKWKYFIFGSLIWVLAVVPKYIMDFTVLGYVVSGLSGYGIAATLIGLGLYVGLRTGLFESGFSYLAIKKTKFSKMNLKEALAFGIGFGSIEAIALGTIGLLNVIVLLVNPAIVEQLTPAQQASLNLPVEFFLAPLIERVSALSIHIFASLLVFYAIAKKKASYLIGSVLFKAFIDGILPAIGYYIDLTTLQGIYVAEIPIAILGLLAFYGIKHFKADFQKK
jgi:uncharacterized membrane protein YhfC